MELLKKSRTIIALIVAMISSFPFVSCDPDPDVVDSAIVGTWTGTASYSDGSKESFTYIFNSNGTFSAKYWDGGVNDFDPLDFGTEKGNFEYDDKLNILKVSGVDEDGDYFSNYWSCTISGNKMVWVTEYFGGTVILTKK